MGSISPKMSSRLKYYFGTMAAYMIYSAISLASLYDDEPKAAYNADDLKQRSSTLLLSASADLVSARCATDERRDIR